MKSLINLHIIFVFVISALSSWAPIVLASTNSSTCENGECIPKLVDRLEDLNKLYKAQCLPKNIKHVDIPKYHESNPLTEDCWKFITEISHLEEELLKHQNRLEARLGCEGSGCRLPNPTESLNAQLADLEKVEEELSCTPEKKEAVKKQTPRDMACLTLASALSIGGYVAELITPPSARPKGCSFKDDNCSVQFMASFFKSVFNFFKGAWDLLKIVGRKTGQGMKDFWNWVNGAEDHSSTSQLALAKASEDPSIFNELVNDFPGTMKKIWNAFVEAMVHWMKAGVFCQKWSSVPHFSQCLKPTNDFDCIPRKTLLTGLCSISGTLVAEIVPAFLSGGLTIAVKQGVNGAVKIARGFQVSQKSLAAIKASRAGKIAVEASTKVDNVVKVSAGIKAAKAMVNTALLAIKTYMLSPARKAAKASLAAMIQATRKGKIYLARTPRGRAILFGGKTVKLGAQIVLYPIDNPLTSFAYRAGYRTFDKAFKLGKPTLGVQTAVTLSLTQKTPDLELLMAQLDELKLAAKPDAQKILKLETTYLARLEPVRLDALKTTLKKGESELSEIITRLYPELEYGDLARIRPKNKVLAAEEELYIEISNLPQSPYRQKMMDQFENYFAQGERRAEIVGAAKVPPHSKVELGRALSKIQTEPSKNFHVIVEQAAGQYSFKVTNLGQKEANRLAQALADNEAVIQSLQRNLNLGKNRAYLEMSTDTDGIIDLDKIKLRSAPIAYEAPDIAPMNITGGITKFVSPTFRTAGATEEDRRKKEAEKAH